MSQSWTKEDCPFCGIGNWINEGDVGDVTLPDIDACLCWLCGGRFFLCEDFVREVHAHDVFEACRDPDCRYATWRDFLRDGAHCREGLKRPE